LAAVAKLAVLLMALVSLNVTLSNITSSNLDSFLRFLRTDTLHEVLRLLAQVKNQGFVELINHTSISGI
jgi:hypothetical protein